MKKSFNIQELKDNLPEILKLVAKNNSVIISRRNQPVAELISIKSQAKKNVDRKFGQHKKLIDFDYVKFEGSKNELEELFMAPIVSLKS